MPLNCTPIGAKEGWRTPDGRKMTPFPVMPVSRPQLKEELHNRFNLIS